MFRSPIQIDLDITHGCNLKCVHCSANAGKRLDNEMTTMEIMTLIDDIYSWGVMNITIAGGEPLLRNDCMDIVEYAVGKRGMLVTLVTNAILLTDTIIDRVSKCKGLQLVVSLDAPSQDKFDQIRVGNKNTFSDIWNKIDIISKTNISYSISYVATKINLTDFFVTYKKLNEIGVDRITLIKFVPVGRGDENKDLLMLDYDTWKDFILKLTKDKMIGKYKNIAISIACPNDLYVPLMENGYTEEQVEEIWGYVSPLKIDSYKEFRELGCHAGVTNLSIAANGDVYPCAIGVSYPGLCCGNIKKEKIEKIWFDSKLLNDLRNLKLKDISDICLDCNYKSICGGGCRIRGFVGNSKIDGADFECGIVLKKGED